MGSIIDVALERNIVGKSGSWYTYGEQRIGQGRENAKAFLEEHTDVADEIATKIRDALKATIAPNGLAKPVGVAAKDDAD
jgi:recombination protein RecA